MKNFCSCFLDGGVGSCFSALAVVTAAATTTSTIPIISAQVAAHAVNEWNYVYAVQFSPFQIKIHSTKNKTMDIGRFVYVQRVARGCVVHWCCYIAD